MPDKKLKWEHESITNTYFAYEKDGLSFYRIRRDLGRFALYTNTTRYFSSFKYLKSAKACAELVEFG